MEQQELNTLMQESAADAVQNARELFNLELSYDADSVKLVDDALLSYIDAFKDKALEDNAVFTLCNIYGAFVGEVFKSLVGGNWRYDQTDPKAPFVVLDVADRSYAFAGMCYERLVNDSQVSVKAYFDIALKHQAQ